MVYRARKQSSRINICISGRICFVHNNKVLDATANYLLVKCATRIAALVQVRVEYSMILIFDSIIQMIMLCRWSP